MQVATSNLVPKNISSYDYYYYAGWTEAGNTAVTEDGVMIKLISPRDDSLDNPSGASELTYQLTVPHWGSYDVTVSRPYGSVFFIVTKIMFYPDAFNAAADLTAWLKENTDIPVYLPLAWQPVVQSGAQGSTDEKYPYYYFELRGDAYFYDIHVYRSEEAVGLNDQKGYIENNGRPISEADFIGSIRGEKIMKDTPGLAVEIPSSAESFELIPGLTAYEKDEGASVGWKEKNWGFEFFGSPTDLDTLRDLAAAWRDADIRVSPTGKVKIVGGNRLTFYYAWDKDGYRYEFTTHSMDLNETIRVLNSFMAGEPSDEIPVSFIKQKLYHQRLPVLTLEDKQIICEGKIEGVTQGFYRSDSRSETGIEFYSYLSIGGVKYDLDYVGYGANGEYEDMLKSCGFTVTDIDSKAPVYQQTRILGAAAATTSYFTIINNVPYLLYDMPGMGGQYDIDGDGRVETVSNSGGSVFRQEVVYEWRMEDGYVDLLPLAEVLGCDIVFYIEDENCFYTYTILYEPTDDGFNYSNLPPVQGPTYRYSYGRLVRISENHNTSRYLQSMLSYIPSVQGIK